MTLITKLSNERLDEIMQIRKATGATSTVQVLESNELENYMVNLNDAIARQDDKMNRYKEGGAMHTCSQELKAELLVIKAELIARMESEKNQEEMVIVIPKGQRFVTLGSFDSYEGVEVNTTVSTGKRTKRITAIHEVYTDAQVKEVWVYGKSPSGAISIVGIEVAKKYKKL